MTFKSLALLATLATAPISAQAATIVYQADGDAAYDASSDGSFVGADFFDDGSDGIDIAVSGTDTSGLLEGALFVSNFDEADPELLTSETLVSYTIGPASEGLRTLTAVFGGLSGAQADLFGEFATVVFTFTDGDEADGELSDVEAAILSDVAPIPLPASLPLLLAGVGVIAATRRRRG